MADRLKNLYPYAIRTDKNTLILKQLSKCIKPPFRIYKSETGITESDWVFVAETWDGEYELTELPPFRRVLFQVRDSGNRIYTFGERKIHFEGAANFRDLGGYHNKEGKVTRWGLVYRADGLFRMTENDNRLLQNLSIQTIIDFRTEKEIEKSPDLRSKGSKIRRIHLPVKSGEFDFATAMDLLLKGEGDWPASDFMVKNYESYLDRCQTTWREVFSLISDENNLPLVFHCTGGKDRSGACAALLLSLLGITEGQIIEDHQLSNECIAPVIDNIRARLDSQNLDTKKLEPFLTAPLNAIQQFLFRLTSDYGDAFQYLLKAADMEPSVLERIRHLLLEPSSI